ncbi:hypothetical protein H9L21_05625 [Aeromicrobium senzhongii]|uniref:Alpha/beta hydrolase n=1 Tax=Aeromicrobium senzhongii TaxID=2663859 RepID=A0ABX6SVH1_9ACTN|nr:hypothetical protein [Aeromicrobium senzhongii]MTB87556.1 hypothetical protein [Aeromicrobium senzhongii]QNL95403.1 hypothetical protein H9L21_05625 [Aeromicrobium senzhongii]
MTSILLTSEDPRGILLFAPGAAGDPTRYERLLTSANEAGFIVASPEHDLDETFSDEVVRERVTALAAGLEGLGHEDLPVVAAGHSLGGCAALCLAGVRPRNSQGAVIDVPREPRVGRVVVLAPATGWFEGRDALDDLSVPITVFIGAKDDVTPPDTAEVLWPAPTWLELRTYEGVGHFDFMWPLPENKVPTPGLDHEEFYERFIADFVTALG